MVMRTKYFTQVSTHPRRAGMLCVSQSHAGGVKEGSQVQAAAGRAAPGSDNLFQCAPEVREEGRILGAPLARVFTSKN
jgi:hypothetical protein